MAEAYPEPVPHPAWPRLEAWLTEASAQAGARRETRSVQLDAWTQMAKAALAGDRAGLAGLLSQLNGAQADPIGVVSAQFEVVVDVLSASDVPPARNLWRLLMACQSAILAEAARLATPPVQPSVSQLHTLIDFSREIVTIMHPETLVEQVVSLMYQRFGYQYVHLFLMDAAGQHVSMGGGLWNGQPARPGECRTLRVGEEGIVGWVAARGEPAVVPDVASDARSKAYPMLPDIRSEMSVPLKIAGRVLGVLDVQSDQASAFAEPDLFVLRAVADQVAIAIENARLHVTMQRRLREQTVLYETSAAISANLDLTKVLGAIVRSIRRALNCRGCCIFLLDETSQMLEIKAAAGLKPKWRDAARLRIGEGIAGRAAAEARTVYLIDTLEDPEYIFFDREVRSLLAVPMQVKGRVIGVINVDERVPDAFGPDQERLLTIAAAQAAIAIENARLFSEMLSEKKRTDAIIRYMADGLLMLDRHKVVVSCNPALARMLGMRRADILGQPAVTPDADPRLRAICEPTTAKERTGVLAHEAQISRTGPTGEPLKPRRLHIFSTPVNDETGQRMGEVRVIHDVTKEREIEEMKDEFFSTISHELRTPLFSIQGFVRLILDGEVPDAETQREFLGIIGRQAEQLAQLVNNLLNISRLESDKFEMERDSVQLLDVLGQTASKLQGMAQAKGIALETNLPTRLPPVVGDQGWLEQVATNLVGNAIKFTPEGGRVWISAQQSNGQVLVEVSDTGIGIPADALDRIFEKFYRVSHKGGEGLKGTGLGLHIARQIVELHDGRIWAESTVGDGSTFRFILPCG